MQRQDEQIGRREVLKSSGAIATTPAFWGPFTSDDDDSRPNDLEYDSDGYPIPPDHITVRDDIEELREFQPKLYYDHIPTYLERREAKTDVSGMYGWTAESSEHELTAHCYWVRSVTQRSSLYYVGVDASFFDSHHRDHEPIYVFRRPDKTVDTVVCTGGHHFGLWIDGEWGPMTEDRVSDRETHVNLQVIRPHNHFMEAPSGEEGEFIGEDITAAFGSFRDIRADWYDEGRYEKTSHRAVEDPFVFLDEERHHWWRDDTWDARFNKLYVRVGLNEGTSRNRLKFEEE